MPGYATRIRLTHDHVIASDGRHQEQSRHMPSQPLQLTTYQVLCLFLRRQRNKQRQRSHNQNYVFFRKTVNMELLNKN